MNIIKSISVGANSLAGASRKAIGKLNHRLVSFLLEDSVKNSNVLIVFIAKEDPNGAISVGSTPLNSLRLHWQNHTKIIYKTVSSIDEMNQFTLEVKNRNNRINGLWIHAHGCPIGFNFGEFVSNTNFKTASGTIQERNAENLKPALDCLEKKGVVVLECCETAKIGLEGNASMAQTIASLAPGRKVIASRDVIYPVSLNIKWKDKYIDVTFTSIKQSSRSGIRGKLSNLFHTFLFLSTSGLYGREATIVLKDYQPRASTET